MENAIFYSVLIVIFCCFRSSRPEVFCKKSVPKNLARFTEKHLRRRNSGANLFLWISPNFYEYLLCRTSADCCFCCLSQLSLFLLIQMRVLIWELSPCWVCFPPQMKQRLQFFRKWKIVTICTICIFQTKTYWCFRRVIVVFIITQH